MGLRAGKASGFGLLCGFVSARTLTAFWLIPAVRSRSISLQEREKPKGSILSSRFCSRRLVCPMSTVELVPVKNGVGRCWDCFLEAELEAEP